MQSEIKTIIQRIKQTLNLVNMAYNEMIANPNDINIRQKSLSNIITFGRAVTFVIQNLKTPVGVEKFNTWYNPIQDEMRGDELLVLFKDARNELEKQGKLKSTSAVMLNSFNTEMISKLMKNMPENATSFFIGDKIGGSGWNIQLADGTTEKLYIDLNLGDDVVVNALFHAKEFKHKGQIVTDTSIENCCKLFCSYLNNLVDDAISNFIIKQ